MELARLATPSDRPACVGLLDPALEAARQARGGPALLGEATTASLLGRWCAPGAQLFVGEFEGALVGLLGLVVGPVVAERRSGLVECCYVEPGARDVGVGTALLEAAVAWSRAQGCTDVDALALPGDRQIKQRLEAAGFTARLLTLSRRLD